MEALSMWGDKEGANSEWRMANRASRRSLFAIRYGRRRQHCREKPIAAVADNMALVGLHQPHERAVPGPGASDQAACTRIAEVVARQIVAAVLVDAEQAGVLRVAVAPPVLVGVAEHRDIGYLHQRLMVMVQAETPRVVLAE